EETHTIQVESLPPRIREVNEKEIIHYDSKGDVIIKSLSELEKEAILKALNHFGWTEEGKIKAANALGISRATIYRKIQKYDLNSELSELLVRNLNLGGY